MNRNICIPIEGELSGDSMCCVCSRIRLALYYPTSATSTVHLHAGDAVQRLAILRQIVHRAPRHATAARAAHPHRVRVLLVQIVQTHDDGHRTAAAAARQIRFRSRPPAGRHRVLSGRSAVQRIAGSQMAGDRATDLLGGLDHIERTGRLKARGHVGRMRCTGAGTVAAVRIGGVDAVGHLVAVVAAGRRRGGGRRWESVVRRRRQHRRHSGTETATGLVLWCRSDVNDGG